MVDNIVGFVSCCHHIEKLAFFYEDETGEAKFGRRDLYEKTHFQIVQDTKYNLYISVQFSFYFKFHSIHTFIASQH